MPVQHCSVLWELQSFHDNLHHHELYNVGGNAIFIFGFNMGAAGAALATLISRIVGAIFILILLKRPGQHYPC